MVAIDLNVVLVAAASAAAGAIGTALVKGLPGLARGWWQERRERERVVAEAVRHVPEIMRQLSSNGGSTLRDIAEGARDQAREANGLAGRALANSEQTTAAMSEMNERVARVEGRLGLRAP